MKIRVDFTIEVPVTSLTALGLLADDTLPLGANSREAADFVRMDAEEYVIGYLTDNGVQARVIRRQGIDVSDQTHFGYRTPEE